MDTAARKSVGRYEMGDKARKGMEWRSLGEDELVYT